MTEKKSYHGTERREFCAMHCVVSEQSKKSVPRWVFTIAVSVVIVIGMAFGGWHVASLRTFKIDMDARFATLELRIESRVADLREQYNMDVQRFYRAAERNEELLTVVAKKVDEVDSKVDTVQSTLSSVEKVQSMVVEKIGLSKP